MNQVNTTLDTQCHKENADKQTRCLMGVVTSITLSIQELRLLQNRAVMHFVNRMQDANHSITTVLTQVP